MPEQAKKLLGENSNFLASKEGATTELQKWAVNNPPPKDLDAVNKTAPPVAAAQAMIGNLKDKTVTLYTYDNTGEGVRTALFELDKLPAYRGISIGIERVGGGAAISDMFREKGTKLVIVVICHAPNKCKNISTRM